MGEILLQLIQFFHEGLAGLFLELFALLHQSFLEGVHLPAGIAVADFGLVAQDLGLLPGLVIAFRSSFHDFLAGLVPGCGGEEDAGQGANGGAG